MKRREARAALSEHQQVALAVVLVILLAGSLLYCLGFGSVALRQVWESRAPIVGTLEPDDEELEPAPVITMTLSPTLSPALTPTMAASPPVTPTLSPAITLTQSPAITLTAPGPAGSLF